MKYVHNLAPLKLYKKSSQQVRSFCYDEIMIKAFLFDYDGVMTVGADNTIPIKNLANNLGIKDGRASEWIENIWDAYSTGELSSEKAWQKIEAQYGKEITSEQKNIWFEWNDLRPLPEMVELV